MSRKITIKAFKYNLQGFFFILLQQAFIDFAQRGIGFFQQVLHAFVGGSERGGFGQLFESGNGLQFGFILFLGFNYTILSYPSSDI